MAEVRPILIENDAGVARAGSLQVRMFSNRERWLRALKMLGLMWLLAGVTLVTVNPAYQKRVLAGPVTPVMRYRVSENVESATGECPVCGEIMTVMLDPAARLPLWTYCTPRNDPIRLRYP